MINSGKSSNRKVYLFFIVLFFSQSIFGQIASLRGTFFSTEQDRISLNKGGGSIMFENSNNYHLYFEKELESNDTLKLMPLKDAIDGGEVYVFKVKALTANYFTLQPISASSKRIFNHRKEVTFYIDGYLIDTALSFEKLIFAEEQSKIYYADAMHIQIDSSKNVYLHFISAFDTAQTGNFKGKMTDIGYKTFITLLRKAHLKRLSWPPSEYNGQAPMTFIVYFNGKRKELHSVGNAPYITMDLVLFLGNIQKYATLSKVPDQLHFDN